MGRLKRAIPERLWVCGDPDMERLWGAPLGTPEGDRLDVLATLVDAYENEHHPMDPPDPIDAAAASAGRKSSPR